MPTILHEKMSKVESSNPYFSKDLKKALNATKFIGRGSSASSTNKYMIAAAHLANTGSYVETDVVFVSAEGQRKGRLEVDFNELQKAIDANVTFVTDDEYNRNRPFNVGEREVAQYLEKNGYKNIVNGVWKKF